MWLILFLIIIIIFLVAVISYIIVKKRREQEEKRRLYGILRKIALPIILFGALLVYLKMRAGAQKTEKTIKKNIKKKRKK